MQNKNLSTYYVSAHGCVLKRNRKGPLGTIPDSNGARMLPIPKNVALFMECNNKPVESDSITDAKAWSFVVSDIHERLSNAIMLNNEQTIRSLCKEYMESFEAAFNYTFDDQTKNTFCMFTTRCPDVYLGYNDDVMQLGVFKAPVAITSNFHNQKDIVDKEAFKAYLDIHKDAKEKGLTTSKDINNSVMKRDFKFFDAFMKVGNFVNKKAENHVADLSFNVNGQTNQRYTTLRDLLENLKADPSFYIVIVHACREGANASTNSKMNNAKQGMFSLDTSDENLLYKRIMTYINKDQSNSVNSGIVNTKNVLPSIRVGQEMNALTKSPNVKVTNPQNDYNVRYGPEQDVPQSKTGGMKKNNVSKKTKSTIKTKNSKSKNDDATKKHTSTSSSKVSQKGKAKAVEPSKPTKINTKKASGCSIQ